ncbi:homeobox protein abdominal-A-like [Drosophila kikkawai]|uniref:Homeobox protein abdominal-A-like n=1 Tax=Drosophila kikkawai TaxID=30033 RepID=A0ABM4GI26_DROKI
MKNAVHNCPLPSRRCVGEACCGYRISANLLTFPDERLLASKSRSGSASGHRWSLLTRASNNSSSSSATTGNNNAASSNNNNNTHLANNNNTLMVKSLNLPKDDSNLVYRRKSSGSTPHQHHGTHHHHHQHHHHLQQQQQQQQHLQQQHQQHLQQLQHLGESSLFHLSDDFECHADGSLLLRIPAPHVVAARAYRLAARKRAAASSEATTPLAREHTLHELPLAEASSSGSSSGSSTTFTRLAKLLHQSSALAGRSNLQPPPPGDNAVQSLGLGLGLGLGEEAPRRLSWESSCSEVCRQTRCNLAEVSRQDTGHMVACQSSSASQSACEVVDNWQGQPAAGASQVELTRVYFAACRLP